MTASQSLLSRLSDPSLLRSSAFVAGRHVAPSDAARTFAIHTPAPGDVMAERPDLGAEDFLNIKYLCLGGIN